MKKFFNLFLVAVLMFSAIALVGCKDKDPEPDPQPAVETEGKGYGIVHKDYVGMVTLKVKEGKVTSAKFDEFFLPSHWAVVTGEVDASLIVEIPGRGGAVSKLAKYIKIGDKLFTANAEGIYSAEGIADLKAHIAASEANAKWYVEALAAGQGKAVDAQGVELTAAYTAKAEGFFKTSENYWPASQGKGLGWAPNMDALAAAIVGTSMNLTADQLVKGEDGKWSFGSVVTGATLTDAKDYYAVAKLAYAAATK